MLWLCMLRVVCAVCGRYLIALLAAYPLAAVFALLPNSAAPLKHLFSLVTGVVLAQFVFGSAWVHALVTSTVVYLVLAGASLRGVLVGCLWGACGVLVGCLWGCLWRPSCMAVAPSC